MNDPHIDAHALALELSPALERLLAEHREELMERAGGRLGRLMLAQLLPLLERYEPLMLELAIGLVAWKFEKLTIGEIVNTLWAIRNDTPQVGQALSGEA